MTKRRKKRPNKVPKKAMMHLGEVIQIICPYCQKPAKWVDNKLVYGKRFGKSYMMWWCKPCDARVGCHNNTMTPLGSMANAELRNWRCLLHELFDPIWKSELMTRGEAYRRLSARMGYQVHMGEATLPECKLILDAINQEFAWELALGPMDPAKSVEPEAPVVPTRPPDKFRESF